MGEGEVVNLKGSKTLNENEDIDFSPLWKYLRTPEGHEIAKRIVALIEDAKRISLDKNSSIQTFDAKAKYFVISLVVASVTTLSYFGKLDSTTGMLFGTIVGYFFGRKDKQ